MEINVAEVEHQTKKKDKHHSQLHYRDASR